MSSGEVSMPAASHNAGSAELRAHGFAPRSTLANGCLADMLITVVPLCEAPTVPDRTWVSKTNVTSYLRCPSAFWLTDSGQLDRAELLSPFEAQLAETGIAFERGIVEAATPIEMPPGGEAELLPTITPSCKSGPSGIPSLG